MQSEPVRIHHNIPQLLFHIIRAHTTLCFWGRATGKTEGPGVDFTLHQTLTLERSLGGLVSVTYDKLLSFIIPKLIKGWEKHGYYEDTHFWFRKFAPKDLKRERPFLSPTDPKHFCHWYNGSGQQLISLDRLGISNAADLDWIYADECRLFDYEKFVEVINANRGNADAPIKGTNKVFGDLPEHHAVLLTTDKPRDSRGEWLYDLASQADHEAVEMILMIQEELFKLNAQIAEKRPQAEKRKIQQLINQFESELKDIRKDTIAVIEASTLDNIDALGTAPIKNFVRQLSDIVYRISILNETIKEVEGGFYKDLDHITHGYEAVNHDWLDAHDINHRDPQPDCRWYTDYYPSAPLDIAMDTNARINNIVTGQGTSSVYRLQGSMYYEGRFQLLLDQWNDFYKYHPTKEVNYFHDHTDIKGRPDADIDISEEVVHILEDKGWTVHKNYIGPQPSHKARHTMWERLFSGTYPDYPKFRYNTSTAEYWAERARMTGTIIGKTGFEKDKRDEKKAGFPQNKAPHITDAGDTLLIGAVQLRVHEGGDFPL